MMKIQAIEERFPNPERGADYEVCYARLADGTRAVWKPIMVADVDSAVLAKGVLAYEVDALLQMGLVPETIEIMHEERRGTLQRFVENAVVGTDAFYTGPRYQFGWMQRLGILDFICSNPDRGPSNWLVRADGSLAAIDNGGCFQSRDTFTWSMAMLVGRTITLGNTEFIGRAHDEVSTICRLISDAGFEVAAELAANHIHVLAGAVGLTTAPLSVLGLIGTCELEGT